MYFNLTLKKTKQLIKLNNKITIWQISFNNNPIKKMIFKNILFLRIKNVHNLKDKK